MTGDNILLFLFKKFQSEDGVIVKLGFEIKKKESRANGKENQNKMKIKTQPKNKVRLMNDNERLQKIKSNQNNIIRMILVLNSAFTKHIEGA